MRATRGLPTFCCISTWIPLGDAFWLICFQNTLRELSQRPKYICYFLSQNTAHLQASNNILSCVDSKHLDATIAPFRSFFVFRRVLGRVCGLQTQLDTLLKRHGCSVFGTLHRHVVQNFSPLWPLELRRFLSGNRKSASEHRSLSANCRFNNKSKRWFCLIHSRIRSGRDWLEWCFHFKLSWGDNFNPICVGNIKTGLKYWHVDKMQYALLSSPFAAAIHILA